MDVGAARFTERFGLDEAVSEATLAEALAAIAADLARLDGRPVPDALVGMGGAVTNLAAVRHGLPEYDAEIVQGTVLDRAELDRQLELYRTRSADERRGIAGLQPKRAAVILAGACIVQHRSRQARARLVHRQRPRFAPRSHRRALRAVDCAHGDYPHAHHRPFR